MFVLFLDIDGVLLAPRDKDKISDHLRQGYEALGIPRKQMDFSSNACDKAAVDLFSTIALNNLNQLIGTIEANGQEVAIVMSSAWRAGRTVAQIKELFKQHPFSSKIIDKTAESIHMIDKDIGFSSSLDRGEEIDVWLQLNSQQLGVTNFLILDDVDSSMTRLFKNNFVHCGSMFGSEEFDKASSLISDKDVTMQEPPEEVKPEDLLNIVTLEIRRDEEKQPRKKIVQEVSRRVDLGTRSDYVTLFSKNKINLPKNCAALIAEYDDPRPKSESSSKCSIM